LEIRTVDDIGIDAGIDGAFWHLCSTMRSAFLQYSCRLLSGPLLLLLVMLQIAITPYVRPVLSGSSVCESSAVLFLSLCGVVSDLWVG
jgi:hypothetical protein